MFHGLQIKLSSYADVAPNRISQTNQKNIILLPCFYLVFIDHVS